MDNVETVTLIVNSLEVAKRFYSAIFEVDAIYEDDVSWVFSLDGLMVNLLQASEAAELVEPIAPGSVNSGPRILLTIRVGSVNVTCGLLEEKGVQLLNGPMDRPWGRRTAAFADPDGNVWEIAEEI